MKKLDLLIVFFIILLAGLLYGVFSLNNELHNNSSMQSCAEQRISFYNKAKESVANYIVSSATADDTFFSQYKDSYPDIEKCKNIMSDENFSSLFDFMKSISSYSEVTMIELKNIVNVINK